MKMMHFFNVCIVYLLFEQTDISTISLTTCVFIMSRIVITLDNYCISHDIKIAQPYCASFDAGYMITHVENMCVG